MKRQALGRLRQFDPVSVVFTLHMTGLLLTHSVRRPLPIALMTLALVTLRFSLDVLNNRRVISVPLRRVRTVITFLLIGGVIIADGGTESPFFFWLLLLIAWEAVTASIDEFRTAVAVAGAVYVSVVLVSGDLTATSVARFGLFVIFILVMTAGRLLLRAYESRIRRLEQMVTSVLFVATQGVVLYDSDRQTPLFANEAAEELGLATYREMARLIPDDATHSGKIESLASLVEDAGWLPYEPRFFHTLADPTHKLRIGVHAVRVEDAAPVIVVYGEAVTGDGSKDTA
jgi:hypothetical protein